MKNKKSNPLKRISRYLGEVQGELKKVTWPNKDTLIKMSIAVFVTSVIFGIYLTLIDVGFRKIIDKIISSF
jgi:preprotein translocase subunit SecE